MPKKFSVQINKELPKKADHILGLFPEIFRKVNKRKNRHATFKIRKRFLEDSSRFEVKENVDGTKFRRYEAPNIPFDGKWAILIKEGDQFTMVPLNKKLIFKHVIKQSEDYDEEIAFKNTFLMMKNRRIKKKDVKKKIEEDKSDNDSFKELANQYSGEDDDEFQYDMNEYRKKKMKQKGKGVFEDMENLLKRKNFTTEVAPEIEQDFSQDSNESDLELD